VADYDPRVKMDAGEVLRGRSLLLAFTGLIPLALMVPILLLRLYAVGLVEGLVAGAAVIGYHLARRQGITSVDLLAGGFAAVSAILYFGFDNKTTIENLDVAIYTLLAVLVVLSLVRRQPWTAQFARRVIPPEMRETPAFHTINMRITGLWAGAFVVCDLLALLGSGPVRRYVPIALLIMFAALVPRLARGYRARLVASSSGPPEQLAAKPQVNVNP
jgi:hypothetical protein